MRVYRYFSKFVILFFLLSILLSCSLNKSISPAQGNENNQLTSEYERLLDQGRNLINDRHHTKALEIFDQAGKVDPQRPEWLYERARALFAMDRFEDSANACHHALDVDPTFYDALSLGWAARIEAAEGSDQIKHAVRQEIESLRQQHGSDTDALMAVYQGYEYLRDPPAQQKLILELAGRSLSEEPEKQDQIADELFEQIISESFKQAMKVKSDEDMQIQLMDAFIRNFPKRRFVEYIVSQLLTKKWETSSDDIDVAARIASFLETYPKSRRINIGVASWLIDQKKMADKAVALLQESLADAETRPEEKPPHFTDKLWKEETDRGRDFIHYLLGQAWFNAGNPENAKTELTKVDAKNRHWGKLYHFLGMIALKDNNPEEAISLFCHALEIDEHQEETKNQLTELLSHYHEYHGAPVGYFRKQANAVYFDDVTECAGLTGIKSHRVAWGDYNRDGFVDLLVDGHRLFKNTGHETFIEVTEESGLGELTTPTGGVWGDYDNDGYLDIFITDHSGNHLFRNTGTGSFIDMTAIAFGPMSSCQTEAAAWGDLDTDGFLDLYVANYERPGVMRALGVQDQLYRNNGNGTFSDISRAAGIITDEAMCGRGATWTDVNRDGYPDIVVANYRLDPNFLWINNHNGTFVDQADIFGVRGHNVEGAFGHSIGVASGDLNNDDQLDLFITNLAHPRYIEYSDKDMLLINQGPSEYHYTNQYDESGISFEETNSDPALADMDNDGDMDLYMTSIYPGRYSHLYENDGNGFFTDATWLSGTSVENSWGAAFADYNNDGYADLIVASDNGLRLFRNNGNSNHWLKINVHDEKCNRQGIDALVTIRYADCQQVREIAAGRGTGSQDDSAIIFGLGDYFGPIDISACTLCGDAITKTVSAPDQTVKLIQ